jgi:hypothetical protein
MKANVIASLGMTAVLALCGGVTAGNAAQRRPPEKEAQYRAPTELPATPLTAAEEPRGPLSLQQVLSLTLLCRPRALCTTGGTCFLPRVLVTVLVMSLPRSI